MSPPRKGRRKKSGTKSAKAGTGRRSQIPSVGRDSLASNLTEARERWVVISEILDVTQAALAEGDSALIADSAASVLFHSVLSPILDEIRRLDELIEQHPREAAS